MIEPGGDEAVARAMVNDADDLAADLLAALSATTSHARTDPLIMGGDIRDVLIDGHFDLVAVARHLRESLHREMLKLLKSRINQ